MISPSLPTPLIAPTSRFAQKRARRIGEPNFTYPKVLRQENYAARKNFVAENPSRDEIEIANQRKFCQI
jgi:hypothetical protein